MMEAIYKLVALLLEKIMDRFSPTVFLDKYGDKLVAQFIKWIDSVDAEKLVQHKVFDPLKKWAEKKFGWNL